MRIAWVVGLALSGCMTSTGAGVVSRPSYTFTSVAAAPTGWSRLETDEFTLTTDLPPAQAQTAAQLIAQSLAGLKAMFARAPVAAKHRVFVYALDDSMEFERRFGRRVGGFATSGETSATLVLYGPPERWFVRDEVAYEGKDSVLQHELAHVVLRQYFTRQQQWFAEGMAQYLETFRWVDPTTARFGDPSLSAYRTYRQFRSISVSDMLGWTTYRQRSTEVAGLYGMSWAFCHWAINTQPAVMGRFMALSAQQGPMVAWQQTFAPMEDTIDKAIFTYMKIGSYQFREFKVPLPTLAAAQFTPLSKAEVDELHSLFDLLGQGVKKTTED
jgi:hypothetical protein